MTWLWIVLIALAVLLFGLFALRIPRNAVTALGAAIAVGLAGYSWQGEPAKPASPPVANPLGEEMGDQVVSMRRQILAEEDWSKNRDKMIFADAYARMGRFEEASSAYSAVVREDPKDAEAWLALGNALVNHADGFLTPPAIKAFRTSEDLDPDTPGVPFFIGLTLVQQGDFLQARGAWAGALERIPEGTEAHALMTERLARLDNLIEVATRVRDLGNGPANGPAEGPPQHSGAQPAEETPAN